jgi:hypothetical protein
MPSGDGTGPLGQGSRTGRGMGNCQSDKTGSNRPVNPTSDTSFGLGRRLWDNTLGGIFRRKRGNRRNRR